MLTMFICYFLTFKIVIIAVLKIARFKVMLSNIKLYLRKKNTRIKTKLFKHSFNTLN